MAIKTFEKTVAVAGTKVALSLSTLLVNRFAVRAKNANTNNIFIGGSDVDSTNGFIIEPSSSKEYGPQGNVNARNLAAVYIDAAVNGEGVVVEYEQV